MRAAVALLLVAGCATASAPPAAPAEAPPRPALTDACPAAPAAPRVPPRPRTVQQVVEWGNAADTARRTATAALAECERRLRLAVRVAESR